MNARHLDPRVVARRIQRGLSRQSPDQRRESAAPSGAATIGARVSDLEDWCQRLQDALEKVGGYIAPPPHLQERVAGMYYPEFFEHGTWILDAMQKALRDLDKDVTSFPEVLDFGCGCARVLHAFHDRASPSQQLHGTDIDPEAIEWCRNSYASMAEFAVNDPMPPMSYGDEAFDLVFSVSVFTHLPQDMELAWLKELRRVTKAGGYVLLTTFNTKHFEQSIPEHARERAYDDGFFFIEEGFKTSGLPDFYRQSFHTSEYVQSRWSEFFDVVAIRERGVDDHQDLVVCRRR